MLNLAHRALAVVVIACTVPAVDATTLDFDDLPAATAAFLSDYQGFSFGTNVAQSTAWYHSSAASTYFSSHSGLRLRDHRSPPLRR